MWGTVSTVDNTKTEKVNVMKGKVKWFLINGLQMYLFYVGLVEGNVVAQNIIKFIVPTMFILWCFTVGTVGVDGVLKKKSSIPSWVHLINSIVMVLLLAGSGWFWCASLAFITMYIQQVVLRSAEDKDGGRFTDKERIEFLEDANAKALCAGKCIFRYSDKGHGFRLHESRREGACGTVREAIDEGMKVKS